MNIGSGEGGRCQRLSAWTAVRLGGAQLHDGKLCPCEFVRAMSLVELMEDTTIVYSGAC